MVRQLLRHVCAACKLQTLCRRYVRIPNCGVSSDFDGGTGFSAVRTLISFSFRHYVLCDSESEVFLIRVHAC